MNTITIIADAEEMLGVDGPSIDLEIPWDIPVIPRKGEVVNLEGLGILESEEFADLEPFLFTVDLVSYAYESGKWKVTLILSGQ